MSVIRLRQLHIFALFDEFRDRSSMATETFVFSALPADESVAQLAVYGEGEAIMHQFSSASRSLLEICDIHVDVGIDREEICNENERFN